MQAPRVSVLIRWVLAASAALGALAELTAVLRRGLDWNTLDKTLFGVGLMLTAIVLVGPELVRWVLFPVNRLVDSVLLPSESEPPPADFTLARFYASQARYEEACEEYAKIIHYHPRETSAYLEGIQAAARANDEAQARKFYRGARRILRSEDEHHLLENVYAARHELPASEPEAENGAAGEVPTLGDPAPETVAPVSAAPPPDPPHPR